MWTQTGGTRTGLCRDGRSLGSRGWATSPPHLLAASRLLWPERSKPREISAMAGLDVEVGLSRVSWGLQQEKVTVSQCKKVRLTRGPSKHFADRSCSFLFQ